VNWACRCIFAFEGNLDGDMIRKQRRQKFLDIGRKLVETVVLREKAVKPSARRSNAGFLENRQFRPQLGPDTDI
jgi:hypothetical protein